MRYILDVLEAQFEFNAIEYMLIFTLNKILFLQRYVLL